MTDIQQWRRKIQPTRTRTPAVDQDEGDASFPPPTPRKGLKPKFSSYFTQANNAGTSKEESLSPRNEALNDGWPVWPVDDPYPSPDADVLIDSVMCRILGSPYEGLNPRFNGVLLQIFEGFRTLADEKQRLLAKAEQDSDRISALEKVMAQSARQWNEERQEYKAEIKRLELLLAKGKGGLAEVTMARQNSVLRLRQAEKRANARKHDTLETIFQFMEKNKRVEEKVWSLQRATMRRKSPSADMRRLSKTLMSQTTPYPELPPGTLTEGPSTLAEASYLEDRSRNERGRGVSDPKTSFSEDDTISTFSCGGDLLPEEAGVSNLPEDAEIRQIAQILARRLNLDVDAIMPKLLEICGIHPVQACTGLTKASPPAQSAATQTASRKNTKLRSKASGFFHKLRPQLKVDTGSSLGRRFSFEAGDDSPVNATISASRAVSNSALETEKTKASALRKSASTPLLADHRLQTNAVDPERPLSPAQHSPTSSTPVSGHRRLSKIPTPISNSALARPRQEREGSESSLLTAIKCAEHDDRRSSSVSSSGYSSPSTSRVEMAAGSQGAASNRLLEHTMALRSNAFATAAAAKALVSTSQNIDPSTLATTHEKHPGLQMADMSVYRKENVQPIGAPRCTADHEGLRYGSA